MKNIIIFFTLFFYFSAFSQDAVIAVGQAEQDKDKLVIDEPEIGDISGDQRRISSELIDLLRNNFIFYKHKFNTIDYQSNEKMSFSRPQIDLWVEKGISYFVASKIESRSSTVIVVKIRLWSLLSKKEILNKTFQLSTENLRVQGHRIADEIYRAITGKPSIFNSKIFFLSDRTSKRDTEKELYIMDFDGRRVDKLTNFNSIVLSPSISADNSKLMFSVIATKVDRSHGKSRIIKNIDLKALDLMTRKISTLSDRPGINSGAIFSAQNDVVYLTLSFSGNADIYELNIANDRMRKVTSHYGDDVDPSITRDGKLMTFLSNRAGRAHIYTLNPQETEKEVKRISFVGQFNATPRFSPDGKEIVFASWVDNGFDLYRIGFDGNNLVRLTKNFGSNEEPSYSPDGEFIIFTSKKLLSRRKAVQDIYIMNREGEILGQLTQDFGLCFSPKWTNL